MDADRSRDADPPPGPPAVDWTDADRPSETTTAAPGDAGLSAPATTGRSEHARLLPGTTLGHYEIEAFVAAGGMGEVYRGRDIRLGRTVAIKVLPATAAADAQRRRRFEHEARAVSALNHAHICVLYDIGCERPALGAGRPPHAGQPVHFLVMEFLAGQTLAGRLARGPLPLAQALEYGGQIGDALHAAHRTGIVHRDLKPANVMLTKEGAKLLDFGLARLVTPATGDTSETQTRPGDVLGTIPYMAPEQLEGRPTDVRTDIFALGVLLYEMATGRRPFQGASRTSVIAAILEGEPEPVSSLQPLAPPSFARLVATCLAKDPDRRWDTAHDVAEQLRMLHESVVTPADSVPASAGRLQGRAWRAFSWLLPTFVVLAMAVISLQRIEPSAPLPALTGVPRQITTSSTWEGEPALSPDGASVAYTSGESGNADVWVVDVRGGTPLNVTGHPSWDSSPAWYPNGAEVAFTSDRYGRADVWKTGRLGGSPTLLVPNARDPAVSPDGTRIAFTRANAIGDQRILVAPIGDVTRARELTGDGDGLWDHRDPAWSPDGRTICYRAQRDLWCIGSDGGRARRLTTTSDLDYEPTWSSDGRSVLFSSLREGTHALWRVSAGGGAPVRVTIGNGPERHPSVSRQGDRLVFATFLDNLDLTLRDMASGRTRRYGGVRGDVQPALSPDGRTLYFISDRRGQYDVWAQELAGIDPVGGPRRLTDQEGTVSVPRASPDGRWVAYGHTARNRREVWVVPSTGGPAVQLTDNSFRAGQPAWSADGSRIAFVSDRSGTDRVWVIPVKDGKPAGPPRQASDGPGRQGMPVWAPVGSRLAFISVEGSASDVWVMNADRPGSRRRVTHGANATDVEWPSTGRLFVNGTWGAGRSSVRSMAPEGGPVAAVTEVTGRSDDCGIFEISRDGGILVVVFEEQRGNIWALEAPSRIY